MEDKIKTLVINHNDEDGICAGAIVKYFEDEVTAHSINYGYKVPWKKIEEAQKVYMVDFGLQPFSDMIKLLEMKGDNFIWIDHHKTSIEDRDKSGRTFKGIQRIGDAGCELTWEYFNPHHNYAEFPKMVKMIGRYDVWDLDYSQELLDLQAGLKYQDIDVDHTKFWWECFGKFSGDNKTDELIKIGKICNKYQQNLNDKHVNSHAFEMEWEGYNFLVCNALNVNSMLFDRRFDMNKHDAMMAFGYTNKNWSISMYCSDKPGVDVGSLAKRYGGGGHKNAAGFQCNELPFELRFKYK